MAGKRRAHGSAVVWIHRGHFLLRAWCLIAA
jgi:hypothetical protein